MRNGRLVALLLCLAAAPAAAAQTAGDQLAGLFEDYDLWRLREFPEEAMSRGNYAFADRVTDQSIDAIKRRHAQREEYLARLRRIEIPTLTLDELLSYQLFELMLANAIEGHAFRMYLAPIGGRYGLHQSLPQMAEGVRFGDRRDYENYLSRLEQSPAVVAATVERLKLGLREGRTPPRVTLEGVPRQFEVILDGGLAPLAAPLDSMPDTIVPDVRAALVRRFRERSLPAVEAAVTTLRNYVVKQYLPGTRDTTAAYDLPDGEAYYAHQLRVMTTTDMSARDIHQLGLNEVQRIRAEMLEVIRKTDFMGEPGVSALRDDALFDRFIRHLRTAERFYYTDPEALLSGYRDICKQVDPWLPKLFLTLPRLPYGVKAIPAFMAPSQTTAYYSSGDIRNAEPGWFYANTYALDQRPKYEMVALALHEAVPGHHLQISLAQEQEGLPQFRRDAYFTAFGEGWALYAERLGIEMGLYQDPYQDFGRLLYEMWRACRLVVDTGMHAFYWSRDRAIAFMQSNTALSELNIRNEVDRYLSWPGQACAYKIGELEFRELRERAETRMGKSFDIRAFHSALLENGTLPLSILQQRMNEWIESRTIRAYD